jgi:hypothetical protein
LKIIFCFKKTKTKTRMKIKKKCCNWNSLNLGIDGLFTTTINTRRHFMKTVRLSMDGITQSLDF